MRFLTLIYMDASLLQGQFGISGSQVAALYSACLCRTSRLLALMESADPHLICRPSSKLESRFRFSGPRFDLFAIIPRRASRNRSAFISCASSCLPVPTAPTSAGHPNSAGMSGHAPAKPKSCVLSCSPARR